jgi:hypothetical protein
MWQPFHLRLPEKEEVMSIKLRVILIITLLSMAACALLEEPGPSQPAEPVAPSPEMVALAAAQAHLEGQLGRELSGIQVAYGPGQWSDTSLGCPQDGVQYEERPVTGFQFEMTVDGQMHELHTSEDGSIVVLCRRQAGGAEEGATALEIPAELAKPLDTARALLAVVLGVSAESLDLESVTWQQVTFPDTGLGCPEPGAAVLEVLTEGYSFLFAYQGHTYEIHTDLTGDSGVMCGETQAAEAGIDIPDTVQGASEKALGLLAQELDTAPEALTLEGISWEEVTFASSALGCPELGVAYLEEETRGYVFMLTHGGVSFEIHTDLTGERGAVCTKTEAELEEEAPVVPESPSVFTSYTDDSLGFGISYPIEWLVRPGENEGEVVFEPAGGSRTIGMTITRLGEVPEDVLALLSDYQVALFSADPTAVQRGEPEMIVPGGWSQLYARETEGMQVLQRATFFGTGYRLLQWAPESQWPVWDDPYIQMLNSLVVLGDSGG